MVCRLAPFAGGSRWWLLWALRCWPASLHAPSSRSGGGGGDAASASLALDRCEVLAGTSRNSTGEIAYIGVETGQVSIQW